MKFTKEGLLKGTTAGELLEAQARIRELETQLVEANEQRLKLCSALEMCITQRDEADRRTEKAEAQLAEVQAALVETIEDATEGAEAFICRAEKAEADAAKLRGEMEAARPLCEASVKYYTA